MWQGACDHYGYGLLQFQGKLTGAHRHFYEAHYGPIPPELELDHTCRIHGCVNPGHLEPVRHVENVQRGKAAKLTPLQVQEIRKLYKDTPLSQRHLAIHYKVGRSQIGKIVRGERWRNV